MKRAFLTSVLSVALGTPILQSAPAEPAPTRVKGQTSGWRLGDSWRVSASDLCPSGAVSPVNPYPGGSPFPPGQEPSLTHVVKVFWTTAGGVITQIDVTATGQRPIQWVCPSPRGGVSGSGIAPHCSLHLRLSASKLEPDDQSCDLQDEGEGTVTVRVHGFKLGDYTNAPTVRVRYFKDGQLIGGTAVEPKPVSEKIKVQQ